VRALDRKLWRDLARMWGQAITIALVVACGVASFVTMRATHASLVHARDQHYDSRRFAHVFARLERAPESLSARLEEVSGVARVHTRIARDVLLPMPGMPEPAVGHVVSVPAHGESPLNALHLLEGRMVEPGRDDETVVLAGFAEAHGLRPGARIPAVLNGTRRELRVVGIAMSPEFVFAVRPMTFIQDDRRFGILWMTREAVAAAFQMEGSFDDVLFSLQPGASSEAVIDEARRVLEPYGLMFVHARDHQLSDRILETEMQQLGTYAVVTPAIFLGVAAFLVNVVLARTLHLQRGQIAMLKAIGYRNGEIGVHYTQMIGIVVLAGAALGVVAGDVLGRGMLNLYRPYFRFPDLEFRLDAGVAAAGVLISAATGLLGGLSAVARAVRIPPAEAMRPESPATYHRPFVEVLGLHRLLGVSSRMVIRELFRRPLRAALSCIGIGFSTAVVVTGYFAADSLDTLVDLQFEGAQREDVEVTFLRPVSSRIVGEAKHLPGVHEVEPHRFVPVRIHADQRERDVGLTVLSDRAIPLRTVATWPPSRVKPPESGIALSSKLADLLGVAAGDRVSLQILEGDRRTVDVTVTGLVDDVFGLGAYASAASVRGLTREEGSVSSVLLSVDRRDEEALVEHLSEMRNVASVTRRAETVAHFIKQTEHMWVTTTVLTIFGSIIAFGVIYNQARIALSMRSRDLASLRVLGFLRSEISAVLLGELALYVLVGIPLGCLLGRGLVELIMSTVDPEGYRMPGVVTARTYAFAAVTTIIASLASALVVRRKLDHLDLVGVLKTRE
jgi:putative ABC transport system permease protein